MIAQVALIWSAYAATLRPPLKMKCSEFAAKYRRLSEKEAEQPGPWDNSYFPYLAPIMDSVEEAVRAGKRGWCMMKSAQGGGSQAIINVWAHLETYWPGPMLYMISKDEVAEEFGRERFSYVIETIEPLRRKVLRGKRTESLTKKRFTDGKLAILGGRSVLNLQSQPYRFVIIDEVDSLLDEIKDSGDPIDLAAARLDSYFGEKLLLAFAHPSGRHRGAAKLYYENSDQRRGYVRCPHCSGEFWLQWSHVKAIPKFGMNKQQAEREASCYSYFCPGCGVEISDAERIMMVRKVVYKSTLTAEEAARRPWIGVHFSQLYMPNQAIRSLAEKYVKGLDSNASMQVFYNKTLGEPYAATIQKTTGEHLRRLIVVQRFEKDPEFYIRGQVPAGVSFLTAGQDSKSDKLHYSIWGWGLRTTIENYSILCGWLIDWDEIERPTKSLEVAEHDLHVFDQLVYDRLFSDVTGKYVYRVLQCGHDTGFSPVTINRYCRSRPGRAIPIKGGNDTSSSRMPAIRIGSPIAYVLEGEVCADPSFRLAVLNTHALKVEFTSMLHQQIQISENNFPRKVSRVVLPADVDDRFIEHCSNEELRSTGRGRRGVDELTWHRSGPNHLWDTSIYAYALAINCDPFQQPLPYDQPAAAAGAAAAPGDPESWLASDRQDGGWIARK